MVSQETNFQNEQTQLKSLIFFDKIVRENLFNYGIERIATYDGHYAYRKSVLGWLPL